MVFAHVLETIKDKVLPQFPGTTTSWITQIINIWNEQTVKDLLNGKAVISEKVINDYLAQTSSAKMPEIRVYAKQNNVVEIHLLSEKWGMIQLAGLIAEVKHDALQSRLTFQLLRKELVGKRFISWLFSLLRISWFTKLFGTIEFGEGIAVSADGDCIKMDFKERLNKITLAKMQVQGKSLLSTIVVNDVKVKAGQFTLDVCLDIKP